MTSPKSREAEVLGADRIQVRARMRRAHRVLVLDDARREDVRARRVQRFPGASRGARCHLNQLSRSRSLTTSPTMISVGALTSLRCTISGSVSRLPVSTRCCGVVPC